MASSEALERRAYVRVPVRGDVVFRGRDHEIHGRVVNLSEVALEVRCQLGFALLGMAGELVELIVSLDGNAAPWCFTGRVQYVRASAHTLVVHYDAPPDLAREIAARLDGSRDGVASVQLAMLVRDRDERERAHLDDANVDDTDGIRQRPDPA